MSRNSRIVNISPLLARPLPHFPFKSAIKEETGKTPHLVVSRLHRSKLDPNRFKDDAAQYHSIAERAYDTFHG
jgi:hypothetical protein